LQASGRILRTGVIVVFGAVALVLPLSQASSASSAGNRCFVNTVRVAGTKTAIGFRVRCFRQTIDTMTLHADSEIKGFRRRLAIRHRHDPDERMSCRPRAVDSGGSIICHGYARAGTELIGRINVPAKRRCSTSVRFEIRGGWPCRRSAQACPAVRSRSDATDGRPSGC
jgi:hypothetical protein